MGQELSLPDWANAAVPAAFQQLNAQEDVLSEGIGQSYPVLGYKGKVWSIRYRGEKKTFIRPDDGTPAAYLDVIILGQAKSKSKSFYKKYEPGQSDGERPICSSIDGVVPDPDVLTPQCSTCALCPRNVWKTDPATGRKGRECTDYKRLAVLVLPTQTSPIFGQPLVEPAFLRVPPASLNSLAIMGDTMASRGFHYSSYITRITFDPNKPHPEMQFRPLQGLTAEEAPLIIELRQDQQVERITTGGFADAGMRTVPQGQAPVTNTGLGAVTGQNATQSVGNPSSGAVSQPQQQVQSSPPQKSEPAAPTQHSVIDLRPNPAPAANGLPASAFVPPATQGAVSSGLAGLSAQPQSNAPAPTNSGLAGALNSGGVTSAPQPEPQMSQPQQVPTGDSGAPEATDSDLDARIANLMKRG